MGQKGPIRILPRPSSSPRCSSAKPTDFCATSTFSPPKIENVELLGYQGNVEWRQDEQGLTVVMPEQKPWDYTITLEIVWVGRVRAQASLYHG